MATASELLNKDIEELKKANNVMAVSINSHDTRLTLLETAVKEQQAKSDAIQEMNINVRLLAENMSAMKTDMSDVKQDIKNVNIKTDQTREHLDEKLSNMKTEIDNVRNEPSKQKANSFDKVVWLIVGGGVTAIVSHIIGLIIK
jgi:Zn-dependent M28 family amino/carboxypeptidase